MKKMLIGIVVLLLLAVLILAGRALLSGTGQIATETTGVKLTVTGPLGLSVTVGPATEPQTVKAGSYRPTQLYRTLEKQIVSEDGTKTTETWQLYSGGPWGDLDAIEVEKGKTTLLKFDGTSTAKVDVTIAHNAGAGASAFLALQLVGPHSEQYSPLIKKNGKTVEAPKLTIFDESGKELHTGKFEYG